MSILYFGVLFQNVIFLKMFTTSAYFGFGLVILLDLLSVSGFCTLGEGIEGLEAETFGIVLLLSPIPVGGLGTLISLCTDPCCSLSFLTITFDTHFPLEQFPFWCYSKYFVLFELGILVEYFSYFDSVHKFSKLDFEQ